MEQRNNLLCLLIIFYISVGYLLKSVPLMTEHRWNRWNKNVPLVPFSMEQKGTCFSLCTVEVTEKSKKGLFHHVPSPMEHFKRLANKGLEVLKIGCFWKCSITLPPPYKIFIFLLKVAYVLRP